MVATPIPAELENLFQHIRDLKARIADIASQMLISHRYTRRKIAEHTGGIPPVTCSGPRTAVLQAAIELHYLQTRIEEHQRQQEFPEVQRIMQEALLDAQRKNLSGVNTMLLNPLVEASQRIEEAEEIDDDATEIRPVVKPPIPLQWKCKRTRNENVQQHFARCAKLFTEMYDKSPEYIQVTPDDNLTLTLYDLRFPRKEQEDIEDGWMIAVGAL